MLKITYKTFFDLSTKTGAYKVIDTLFCPTCRKPRNEVLNAEHAGFAVLKRQGVIEYRNWTDKAIKFQDALTSLGIQDGAPGDAEPISQDLSCHRR